MTGLQAYQLYLSLRLHFTSDSYDYFKYGGKTRQIAQSKFDVRKDRYQFEKLARHPDPINLLVSNFIVADLRWIGDINIGCYTDWQKRTQSLSYMFENEIKQLTGDFNSYFVVSNGQHPKILTMYGQGTISIETIVIINELIQCFDLWNRKIQEKVIWPTLERKFRKYRPFLKIDVDKYRHTLHTTLHNEYSGQI